MKTEKEKWKKRERKRKDDKKDKRKPKSKKKMAASQSKWVTSVLAFEALSSDIAFVSDSWKGSNFHLSPFLQFSLSYLSSLLSVSFDHN